MDSALSGLERRNHAPMSAMLVVGSLVLFVSIASFFRVPLLPDIGAELRMSAAELGMVTTVFAVGRLLTDLPAGYFSDRAGPVRMFVTAGLALAVGSATLGFSHSAGTAFVAAGLLGVASATAHTTGMAFFSGQAPPHLRGSSLAAFSAALLGGQAIGPALGGLVASRAGWRNALAVAAAAGGAVMLASWVTRRRLPAALSGGHPSNARPEVQNTTPQRCMVERKWWKIRRERSLQLPVLYAVSWSLFFMIGALPQTLVPIIGDVEHQLSVAAIGAALGLGGLCRLLGALVGGRLADRVSRKAALVPGLGLSAVGAAGFAFEFGVGGWLLAIVLLSLGAYGFSTAATMVADRSLREGRELGRALGRFRFFADLGLIAGPISTAWLYEQMGTRAVLVVASLLAAVALASAAILDETKPSLASLEIGG